MRYYIPLIAYLLDRARGEVMYTPWTWSGLLCHVVLSVVILILMCCPKGTRGSVEHLKFEISSSRLPIYRTERGGEVTYHGPGQVCLAFPFLGA